MAQAKKIPTPPDDEPKLNGFLVNVNEDGSLTIQALGESKPTEAATVLRIAALEVEKQFGI